MGRGPHALSSGVNMESHRSGVNQFESRSRPLPRPSRSHRLAASCTALLFFLPLAMAGGALATGQSIHAPTTVNTTVQSGAFDKFAVTPASGGISVKVTVTSGGPIDVLVHDPANQAKYENPNVMEWEIKDRQFNTRSWSGQVSSGGLMYLVIENAETTTGGVAPTGSVTYTAEFTAFNPVLNSVIGAIVVIGGLAALVLVRRQLRGRALRRGQVGAGGVPPGAEQVYAAQGGYPQAQSPTSYAQYAPQPANPYAPPPPYPPPPQPPYPPPPPPQSPPNP